MHALRRPKSQQLIAANFTSSRQQLLGSPQIKRKADLHIDRLWNRRGQLVTPQMPANGRLVTQLIAAGSPRSSQRRATLVVRAQTWPSIRPVRLP